jgi:hypothetical protein
MQPEIRSVQLADTAVTCPCHAIGFFNSREDENAVLLRFIAEGIAAGDTCVIIIDGTVREECLQGLAGVGIDVLAAQRSGQLELRSFENAQVTDGYFDPQRTLAGLEAAVADGLREQRTTRLWSNQDWVLLDLPGTERVVECESRFNEISQRSNDVVVCAYDTTKFGADLMLDVLRAHPVAIIGGKLRQNPFYVPPGPLLPDLQYCTESPHVGRHASDRSHPSADGLGMFTGSAEGTAALGICESLLLALTERNVIDDKDLCDVLTDVATTHMEAARDAIDPVKHWAVAKLIERMLVGKRGVQH